MNTLDGDSRRLQTRLAETGNVLLLAPSNDVPDGVECAELLSAADLDVDTVIRVDPRQPPANAGDGAAAADPSALVRIGDELTATLAERPDDADQLVGCVRSLTALLGRLDIRDVFRFLFVLTRQLAAAGALVHFHLDPTAHDDQTVGTVAQLFDAVVKPIDGGWRVATP